MMNRVITILIGIFVYVQFSYAENSCDNINELKKELIYQTLPINNNEVIFFERKQYNMQGAEKPFDYRINIISFDCKSRDSQQIDLLPYWGGAGKIKDAFKIIWQGKVMFFVIFEAPSPSASDIPYSSDYFFVFAYEKGSNGKFELNEKVSKFLGSAADVTDLVLTDQAIESNYTGELPINAYSFPYKTKQEILSILKSDLFINWMEDKPITGKILQKTKLQKIANYNAHERRYLIKGDKFTVTNVTAGWLAIDYQNPKKGKIAGWIMCKDTDICTKH